MHQKAQPGRADKTGRSENSPAESAEKKLTELKQERMQLEATLNQAD